MLTKGRSDNIGSISNPYACTHEGSTVKSQFSRFSFCIRPMFLILQLRRKMVVLGLTQIDHKYIIPFNSPLDNTSTDNSINHCVHPYISTRVTNYYSLSLSLEYWIRRSTYLFYLQLSIDYIHIVVNGYSRSLKSYRRSKSAVFLMDFVYPSFFAHFILKSQFINKWVFVHTYTTSLIAIYARFQIKAWISIRECTVENSQSMVTRRFQIRTSHS